MRREIQAIPPAPRIVRWGAVLAYRWPVGLVGASLAVYGGVFTWMLFLAFGGKASDNAALDQGPVARQQAVVQVVEPGAGWFGEKPAERITYAFHDGTLERRGMCFAPAGSHAVGASVEVEVHGQQPHLHRIAGSRLDLLPWFLRPETWFALTIVPGCLALLAYAASFMHVRNVLAHGDVGVALIGSARRIPLVIPAMLDVRYRFRDHRANECKGRHWVRVHGELGRRILDQLRGGSDVLPVVHDRKWPQYSRLVLPCDFEAQPAHQLPREILSP